MMQIHPSGYYAWLKKPLSNRALEDARLVRLIRASFVASQGIYGAPRGFLDLGLIRFGRQFDYAANRSRYRFSNSAGLT